MSSSALVNLSGLREKHDPVARNLVTVWRSELLALIEVAEASCAFLASDYEPQAHARLNAALDLIDFGADRALAEAWGDYLDRHRDEIAENFERAAELIRAGDTHGLAEHVGRNRRARAEAAASDSHAATGTGISPDEFNALVDERDGLREALRDLLADFEWLLDEHPEHKGAHSDGRIYEARRMLGAFAS